MADLDLVWAMRHARARIAYRCAAAAQAEAFASYGLTRLGEPMPHPEYAWVHEEANREQAYGLRLALEELDSWAEAVGVDLTQEA